MRDTPREANAGAACSTFGENVNYVTFRGTRFASRTAMTPRAVRTQAAVEHEGGVMPNQDSTMTSERNDRISKRGFASMDRARQREIARLGGRAAHQRGTAHEFTREEAREAGRKGGVTVSQDREHMARIGRRGGERRSARLSQLRGSGPATSTTSSSMADTVETPSPVLEREGSSGTGSDTGNTGT